MRQSAYFKMRQVKGFSLIELLVTVAGIAILAAIAYPSYTEQIKRSRRADAQAILVEASAWMERYYSQFNDYNASVAFATSGLTQSPRSGSATPTYTISLTIPTLQTYTLTATPTGSMVSDSCGQFILNSVGQRTQNPLASATNPDCWGK